VNVRDWQFDELEENPDLDPYYRQIDEEAVES